MEYTTGGIVPAPKHLYEHQTVQYFRAPHIYVAFPPRFMYGRSALTREQGEAAGIVSDATQPNNPNWLTQDCADAAFMTSRGGTLYDRTFMGVFVRPGSGHPQLGVPPPTIRFRAWSGRGRPRCPSTWAGTMGIPRGTSSG